MVRDVRVIEVRVIESRVIGSTAVSFVSKNTIVVESLEFKSRIPCRIFRCYFSAPPVFS